MLLLIHPVFVRLLLVSLSCPPLLPFPPPLLSSSPTHPHPFALQQAGQVLFLNGVHTLFLVIPMHRAHVLFSIFDPPTFSFSHLLPFAAIQLNCSLRDIMTIPHGIKCSHLQVLLAHTSYFYFARSHFFSLQQLTLSLSLMSLEEAPAPMTALAWPGLSPSKCLTWNGVFSFCIPLKSTFLPSMFLLSFKDRIALMNNSLTPRICLYPLILV